MRRLLNKLWNEEATSARALSLRWLPVAYVLAFVVYAALEVLLFPPGADFISLPEFREISKAGTDNFPAFEPTRIHFSTWWIGLICAVAAFRLIVLAVAWYIGIRSSDKPLMMRNFMVYFPSAMLGVVTKLLIFALVAVALLAAGWTFADGFAAVDAAGAWLMNQVQEQVPTLVNVNSKGVALVLAFTLFGFTNYFIHWLTHVSRFLWHVAHAPHHMPDYLHPVASPVAYMFDILLLVPGVVAGAVLTKLFYSQPLVLEVGLITLFAYAFEVFNHTTVFYRLCVRNPVLAFVSNFFGGHGAYHYLHHSSAKEHQMANLGGGLFLMWDRIFGTFVKPPPEPPAIGLTGNPELRLNPFRVMFGGLARIFYELKMNRGIGVKLKILFGGVHYMPPVTHDFVKK